MSLLSEMTLIEPKSYVGRHRKYVNSGDSIFGNKATTVEYTMFNIAYTSVQPIDGHTLQALPEGYRSRAIYQFWTETPISGLEENTNQLSDQIEIDGQWYSVYNFKDWNRTSFLLHYHCVAVKEVTNNSRDQTNTEGGDFGPEVLV
jgi:hypothetical protein